MTNLRVARPHPLLLGLLHISLGRRRRRRPPALGSPGTHPSPDSRWAGPPPRRRSRRRRRASLAVGAATATPPPRSEPPGQPVGTAQVSNRVQVRTQAADSCSGDRRPS